jgi:hypothetical protein
MKNAVLVLSALSAAVSAAVSVLVASPGVGLPAWVIVAGTALAAALAAAVAALSRPPAGGA